MLATQVPSVKLTLKRLAEKGVNLTPPVVFLKLCFLERGYSPDFLERSTLLEVTFSLKISLKFIKLFRRYEDFPVSF